MVVFQQIKSLLSASALALMITPSVVAAEVMFEGYYRVDLEKKPIGFAIQRYEFDSKTKNFISTYFIKVNLGGQMRQESLKATSNDKFQPIGYQYTYSSGDSIKTIDAKYNFAKDKVNGELAINDGKSRNNMISQSPKGTFLSNFLGYIMLQNGLAVGKKFTYSAVAEEDGNSYKGESWLKEETQFEGEKVFRVLNKFKGESFVSFLNSKAEVIGTLSPTQNLSTTLMATPAEATVNQTVPTKILTQIFGNVPLGTMNPLAKAKSTK